MAWPRRNSDSAGRPPGAKGPGATSGATTQVPADQVLVPQILGILVLITTVLATLVLAALGTACGERVADSPATTMPPFVRGVHMGGNWGTNVAAVRRPPPDYFAYLRRLGATWVGVSVALHVVDSADSTVARRYEGVQIPTFGDADLAALLRTLKQAGYGVYLTLAIEDQEARAAARPVQRWQLGDPAMPAEDPRVDPAAWPWRPDHPDHGPFVRAFWSSYTRQAVHFARIAQATGVDLFSLGTETDRLFRSRSGGLWREDFGPELADLVARVRQVYDGSLTYVMHYSTLLAPGFYGPGSDHLWEDLDLDVVGLSAYFPLADAPADTPPDADDLAARWDRIFTDRLQPLRDRNAPRPLMFLEFGYVDTPGAAFRANAGEFSPRRFVDADADGLDDGEVAQARILQAFFAARRRHPSVVAGLFLWGEMMADRAVWEATFAGLRTFSVRGHLAEAVVAAEFGPPGADRARAAAARRATRRARAR